MHQTMSDPQSPVRSKRSTVPRPVGVHEYVVGPAGLERGASPGPDWTGATCAMVLAGGRGTRLRDLTDGCAKPALPFAGRLKIIDFTLSNCLNSGIAQIGVLTQYEGQGIARHVMRNWSHLRAGSGTGIAVLPAWAAGGKGGYSGTADAVYQNLHQLRRMAPRLVLVLSGDHVYRMDYRRMLADHVARGADLTVGGVEVPLALASEFGIMRTDASGRVLQFDEKPTRPQPLPGSPDHALASMGIYVFNAPFLYAELARDAADGASRHDFGHDILPGLIARAHVHAHNFAGSSPHAGDQPAYWRDVGTLDAYWQANLDFAGPTPRIDLHDRQWPIGGQLQALPMAWNAGNGERCGADLVDVLLSDGCVIRDAVVRRSVLSPGVRVEPGARVEDSVLLPGAVVGREAVVRRAIVDAGCEVPDGMQIGVRPSEDAAFFTMSEQGVTLVTAEGLARCRVSPAARHQPRGVAYQDCATGAGDGRHRSADLASSIVS